MKVQNPSLKAYLMKRSQHHLRRCFLLTLLVSVLGCGGSTSSSGPKTAVQHFVDTQSETRTPYGKIKMETVEGVTDGVKYQTEDRKIWRVKMTKQADGTYKYDTPEEAK